MMKIAETTRQLVPGSRRNALRPEALDLPGLRGEFRPDADLSGGCCGGHG